MSTPNPSKKERRDAARAEREAQERAATASAARTKRLRTLGAVVAGAAVLLVAVVLATSGGDDEPSTAASGGAVAGVAESTAMLEGIAQSGASLGDPKAPVTMIEFADLQCPFCKDFALQTLPRVVQDYVRTGKVRMELNLLTFLGPDSIRGAAVANAAAEQNRLWNLTDIFFYNQGQEQTGYATDDFLRRIAGAVPGLDTAKVFAKPLTGTPSAEDAAADQLAAKYTVSGTPSFVVGPTGGTLQKVEGFDYESIKTALDAALKAAG